VVIRCDLSINHIEGVKQFHVVNTSTSFCWSWTRTTTRPEASEPIGRYLTEQAWPKQREDLILAFHHRTILRLVQTFSAVTEWKSAHTLHCWGSSCWQGISYPKETRFQCMRFTSGPGWGDTIACLKRRSFPILTGGVQEGPEGSLHVVPYASLFHSVKKGPDIYLLLALFFRAILCMKSKETCHCCRGRMCVAIEQWRGLILVPETEELESCGFQCRFDAVQEDRETLWRADLVKQVHIALWANVSLANKWCLGKKKERTWSENC